MATVRVSEEVQRKLESLKGNEKSLEAVIVRLIYNLHDCQRFHKRNVVEEFKHHFDEFEIANSSQSGILELLEQLNNKVDDINKLGSELLVITGNTLPIKKNTNKVKTK